MNINMVTALTSRSYTSSDNMEFTPEMKKLKAKFRRIRGGVIVGPSVTIGCNGGFQWILGNPHLISSTLLQLFTHISGKVSSQFIASAFLAGVDLKSLLVPGGD